MFDIINSDDKMKTKHVLREIAFDGTNSRVKF